MAMVFFRENLFSNLALFSFAQKRNIVSSGSNFTSYLLEVTSLARGKERKINGISPFKFLKKKSSFERHCQALGGT